MKAKAYYPPRFHEIPGNRESEILILMGSRNDYSNYCIGHMQSENVKAAPLYKFSKGVMWKLEVLWIQKLHLPCSQLFYESWKRSLNKYKVVIISDANINWNIIKYIKGKNRNIRIIAWHWNTISKINKVPHKYENYCEEWSFDVNDCIRYGLKNNVQFYCKSIDKIDTPIKYDAMFVGKDKGRHELVMSIIEKLNNMGYCTFVSIVKDKTSHKGKSGYGKPLSYEQIIQIIGGSSCIIDVPKDGQSGLTARVLEAIFHKKKLITTNINVLNYDFYLPENILIWNTNISTENIKKFMESSYKKISDDIVNKYSYESWINNFLKN